MAHKEPAIVAELGRPETPAETAARKAENSRKHRANQTLFNLVVALVASLAIVLFLVLVVVRPDPGAVTAIDYQAVAADAQGATSEQLVAPALPPGWYANDTRFGEQSQVSTWYIGLVTPSVQFVALVQGIAANATWQAAQLNEMQPTGTTSINGITWSVYDHRTENSPGNFAYSMSAEIAGSTILLHGTASSAEFELLASAIAAESVSK